mmetsp:Transcript_51986/g.113244  ORF Transcript_51986/g.113244 Transcript_51986/m.113244 type:complete len:347 (-) Transcript_51986:166-1206(-)
MKLAHFPFRHKADDGVIVRRTSGESGKAALLHLRHVDQVLQFQIFKVPPGAVLFVLTEFPFCFFRQAEQGDDDKEIVVVLPDNGHRLLFELNRVFHWQRVQLVLHCKTQNRRPFHPRAVYPSHLHMRLAVGQEHVHSSFWPSEIVLFDSPWAPIDKADEAPLLGQVTHLASDCGRPFQASTKQVQFQMSQHCMEALEIYALVANGFPKLMKTRAVLQMYKALLLQRLPHLVFIDQFSRLFRGHRNAPRSSAVVRKVLHFRRSLTLMHPSSLKLLVVVRYRCKKPGGVLQARIKALVTVRTPNVLQQRRSTVFGNSSVNFTHHFGLTGALKPRGPQGTFQRLPQPSL